MADERSSRTPERYDATDDPHNPPNSVINRDVRKAALRVYLLPLVILFTVAGGGLLYWTNRTRPSPASEDVRLGTSGVSVDQVGARGDGRDAPGGVSGQGRPSNTQEELERRGVNASPQGPMPGLSSATPIDDLEDVLTQSGPPIQGRPVELRDVEVASVTGPTRFSVRDGDVGADISAPEGSPAVRVGVKVDISGTIEATQRGLVQIRASRVAVR